jgi:nitrate reductase delta subunit
MMAAIFKALSALITYPTEELQAAMPEIGAILADEGLIDPRERADLSPLVAELRTGDLYELQERYVALFDQSRRVSLNLFEHVHGESRDRGQAMVDLAALYEAGGLVIEAGELPDHLPLFLEFLSTRPIPEAREHLANTAPILAALKDRLDERGSVYAGVFAALVALAGTAPAEKLELAEVADLDAEWTEDEVRFGAGDAGCSSDRTMSRIRAARRAVAN